MSLFQASVPVFRHALGQIAGMVETAGREALEARIADAFPAGQQFAIAVGFSLRVTFPLAGREVPELPSALGPRLAVARSLLGAMRPEEFAGAEDRVIRHRAGHADLEQTGGEFLHLYGIPNFFFHMTMGYASLREAGLPLGKADFDGFHVYPAGFRFPD